MLTERTMHITDFVDGSLLKQVAEMERASRFAADEFARLQQLTGNYPAYKYFRSFEEQRKYFEPRSLLAGLGVDEITKIYRTSSDVFSSLQNSILDDYKKAIENPLAAQTEQIRQYIRARPFLDDLTTRILEQEKSVASIREAMKTAQSMFSSWNGLVDYSDLFAALQSEEFKRELIQFDENGTQESSSGWDIQTLLDWLGNDATPQLKKAAIFILLYVVLPYIISIVANLHTPHFEKFYESFSGENKRKELSTIKKELNKNFPDLVLIEYRIVIATLLVVRQNPKANSPARRTLKFGTVVKAIRASGDWTYVSFPSYEEEEPPAGWVFSRYLRPLVKKCGKRRDLDMDFARLARERLLTISDAKPIQLDDL